jgi:hypothetical protein
VCRSTILPAMNIRWQINRDLRVYNIYMYAVQLDKKHVYFMERQRSVKCHGTGPFYLLCCFRLFSPSRGGSSRRVRGRNAEKIVNSVEVDYGIPFVLIALHFV